MAQLTYRPEIDGLRALAVIPVVLFHLGLGLTGGYVGVDIFFVISGFLITSLIVGELQAGTFSLARFWERRIRRIVPAAVVTVLGTLVVGALLLLPADFEDLARSAIAQALLVANYYFNATAGYFSAPAETKPLLHFWSLAVEEQFYLVFPFVLFVFGHGRRMLATWVVGAIAIASFILSAVGAYRFPDATFYLLPGRVWELAVGALLALVRCRLPLPDRVRPLASWLGLAMMIGPVFVYTASTPFPGLAALPPCLGAVLVIWATERGDGWVKAVLSWRPIVSIGLISYSLYLWHWPVQVYAHYWLTGASPIVFRLFVLGVCFGLAVLSWRYIEVPFRARRLLATRSAAVTGALAATSAVVVLGVVVMGQGGFPGRMPEAAVQYATAYEDRPTAEEADVSILDLEAGDIPTLTPTIPGAPRVLLWGDSHARVVSPAVEAACERMGLSGFLASRGATHALLGWGDAESQRHNEAVLRWVERERPEIVILASRWSAVLHDDEGERQLVATVEALVRFGVRVWVMRPIPYLGQDVPRALARAVILQRDRSAIGVTVDEHLAFMQRPNAAIDQATQVGPEVVALDPLPYLSLDDRCVPEIDGVALYYDSNHLTRAGARRLIPMFTSEIERRLVTISREGWLPPGAAAGQVGQTPRLVTAGPGTTSRRGW